MNQLTICAHAKINLSLEVIDKRPDGYHNLRSVMQTIELHDTIYMKIVQRERYLKLVTNLPYLPTDGKNIVHKAARRMIDTHGITDGLFIDLDKRVPVSAGLGGGSADCAAVIVGLRNLMRLPLKRADMLKLGLELGADVPFCMTRGTQLAEGVGEKLTRLAPFPASWIVLAKPPVVVSTGQVFEAYHAGYPANKPDTEKLLRGIARGNLQSICSAMGNDLETVTALKYPIINRLKCAMLEQGALGSMMSGSGPTVFGIFKEKERAAAAAAAIGAGFPKVKDIIITGPFNVQRK